MAYIEKKSSEQASKPKPALPSERAQAQHAVVCGMVDRAVMDNRAEASSPDTTRQLVKLDNYRVAFLGEKGSIHADRIDFISRFHRVIFIDGKGYELPERHIDRFISEVKKAFPSAAITRGHEISYG